MKKYLILEKDEVTISKIQETFLEFEDWECIGITHSFGIAQQLTTNKGPDIILMELDSLFEDNLAVIAALEYYCESVIKFIGISSSESIAYELIKWGFYDLLLRPVERIEVKKTMLRFDKRYNNKTYIINNRSIFIN